MLSIVPHATDHSLKPRPAPDLRAQVRLREARLTAMDTSTDTMQRPAQPSDAVAAVLTDAAEQARQAVVEFSGDTVGEYLGVSFDDDAAATHRFLADLPGYQGWQWAVVVAAAPGADHATISEVVLVPGPTALLAPPWVPWEERVRPGDLGPGDLLAPLPDDPRLVPGFMGTGDPVVDDVAVELGLGRRRLLSAEGRADAAQRWHDGELGPEAAMARATKRVCRDCGFMVPLAGALGAMFGVCCNQMSADGRVVDFFYGCGAHSDTPAPHGAGSPAYEPFDDGVVELVEVALLAPAAEVAEAVEATEISEVTEVVEVADATEVVEVADATEAVEVADAPEAVADSTEPEQVEAEPNPEASAEG